MESYSKLAIGRLQLKAAIKLYYENKFVAAITLASAAEEIFEKIAEKRSGLNALIAQHNSINFAASILKKRPTPLGRVAWARNAVKNELKHNDSGLNEVITYNFEYESEERIMSALLNYEIIVDNKSYFRFCNKFALLLKPH